MKIKHKILALSLAVAFILLFSQTHAFGIASFSRLYNLGCIACHTATPRTNYFGEKFMLRGYEMDRMTKADLPKGHDDIDAGTSCTECHNSGEKGDEVSAKEIKSDLFLHKLGNYLSLRVKFTPFELDTNARKEGNEMKSKVTVGKANHAQFWAAGPIAKNVAVRMEAEVADGDTVGLHNFAVAVSNLFKSNGLLNLRFGGFVHGEWLSISDQKRTFSPHFDIYQLRSANNRGADSVKVLGADPAVELYGYAGPLVHEIGISSGKSASDVNKYKNVFGTLKFYIAQKGTFAGSSISTQYVSGTDSNAAVSQIDKFHRFIISANLRSGPWDVYGTYVSGKDDNWDLATGLENSFSGGFIQALFRATPKVWLGVVYQNTDSDDISIKKNHLLLGVNYYYRQNHFLSVYYDADFLGDSIYHPYKKSAFVVQFRSNF